MPQRGNAAGTLDVGDDEDYHQEGQSRADDVQEHDARLKRQRVGTLALSGAGGVMVNLTRDIIASNGQNGIEASGGNAAVLVDNTSILNNATAALSTVRSGRLLTYQNNRVVGALGSGFTGTAAPQ